MREMNHTALMGKPMRIMWVKRDPYARKTGVGNLYVRNLELLVRSSDLERVFSQYGSVLSCKVVYDECNGKSRQFGFVQMCSDKTAQKAISTLHGSNSTCLSKSLYVAKFVKKGHEKKNLYIKNLEDSITSEALKKKFSKFGELVSAVVMRDEHGNSKGFGFVSFEQSQDAETALSAMNASTWGSKVVYVGFAQKKSEREAFLKCRIAEKEEEIRSGKRKGYGVYVGNLEESVRVEELKQLFESCGHVIFAKVVVDPSQRSRGFGFVYLSTPKGAQCALSMDGMSILKSRPIIVKRAFAKGRRLRRTTSSSHAVQPPVMYNLPLTYMNDMYNVQYIDQNPSYSYNYTHVPFHNYPYTTYSPQPQPQPPLTFFDPTMQYIQVYITTS
ncbi:polyadenylate-binding protein 2-like [Carex rostrata]